MKVRSEKMLYCIVAVALLIIVGCHKENGGENTPPPAPKKLQVITTGSIHTVGTTITLPVYWIDSVKFPLEAGETNFAIAAGVTKKGNDIYIAGEYMGSNHPGGDPMLPCYWINGKKIDLPVTGSNFSGHCAAADLAWFNDTLFILGDANSEAVLWKVKGNFVSVSTLPGKKAGEVTFVKGINLQVYNDQLYFASNHFIKTDADHFMVEAGYFTIDKTGNQVYHVLETGLGDAACYDLSVSSKGLFVVGQLFELGHLPNVIPTEVVWTLQGKMHVFDQLNKNSQRLNEIAVGANGKVYANVFDYDTEKPTVWKTEVNAANFEPLNPVLPAEAIGQCVNLATFGDELAYAYSWFEGENSFAGYVFKGKQVLMPFDSKKQVSLTRTVVFEK
jgi:hypothetical protein